MMRIRLQQRPPAEQVFETHRLITLSDGVFAIAATLLVLGLQLPTALTRVTDSWLYAHLPELRAEFTTYALSFLVIGLYWAAHQRMFRAIREADSRLMWLNLLFLLFIAATPFPTSVLAHSDASPLAVTLYAGTLAITGALLTLIWVYATRERRLVSPDLSHRAIVETTVRGILPSCVFALSIPVAYRFGASAAEYSWLLIMVFSLALSRISLMVSRSVGASEPATGSNGG